MRQVQTNGASHRARATKWMGRGVRAPDRCTGHRVGMSLIRSGRYARVSCRCWFCLVQLLHLEFDIAFCVVERCLIVGCPCLLCVGLWKNVRDGVANQPGCRNRVYQKGPENGWPRVRRTRLGKRYHRDDSRCHHHRPDLVPSVGPGVMRPILYDTVDI